MSHALLARPEPCTLYLSTMVSMRAYVPRPGPSPYEADADATRLDLRPWHEAGGELPDEFHDESGSYIVEEPPVPRRAPANSHVALAPYRPRAVSALLEELPLPHGLGESMLPASSRPAGRAQLRIAIVRLAREVGRELRAVQRRVARTDAACIEILQRLLLAYADGVVRGTSDPRGMAPMIARYGVVLGEILAHRIGAEWSYLEGDNPGAWRLTLPSGEDVYPVARVHRFLLQRNREQDLVGFFLEHAS